MLSMTGWKWCWRLEFNSQLCVKEWGLWWNNSLPVWWYGNCNTIQYVFPYTRRKHSNHEVDTPWYWGFGWQASFYITYWGHQLCKRIFMVLGSFFFTQIEPVASKVAYHVCIGNHEYYWPSQPWRPEWSVGIYGKDGGGECGVPFSCRFRMPGNSLEPTGIHAPDTRNLYYSFHMGAIHFVYMSTETNFLYLILVFQNIMSKVGKNWPLPFLNKQSNILPSFPN